MERTYFSLATRTGFNKSLRHFYAANDLVEEMEAGSCPADVLADWLENDEIVQDQILPLISSVLKEKFDYSSRSCNLSESVSDFKKMISVTEKWTGMDLLAVYYASTGKIIIINPKRKAHWDRISQISKEQLFVVYARHKKEGNKKAEADAISAVLGILSGKDIFINKAFVDKNVSVKPVYEETGNADSLQNAASTSSSRITPKYAVIVSNELFHNGNVEAWKKIIESYNTKYPDLHVHIYHGNEAINDINSLFKWGKVKHGDSIFFQISGNDIKGVSRLQKYLTEGASQRFEQFLKIGTGKVLSLF